MKNLYGKELGILKPTVIAVRRQIIHDSHKAYIKRITEFSWNNFLILP